MAKVLIQIAILFVGLTAALCCKNGEMKRSPFSCDEYDECINNIMVRKKCSIGKIFDVGQCIYTWKISCLVDNCVDGKKYRRGTCAQDYDFCYRGKIYQKYCPYNHRFTGSECVQKDSCKDLSNDELIETNKNNDGKTESDSSVGHCQEGQTTFFPTDCTMYRLCVNGTWIDQHCSAFSHYDIKTNECRYWSYTCGDSEQTCTVNETRDVYGRCTEYEQCDINNKWKMMYCDEGTYFQDGSCQKKPCPLRPVLNNCSYFMKPDSDVKYQCPSEQLFDIVERQCVVKQNAKCLEGECEDGDRTYVPTDCRKYQKCENQKWIEKDCTYLRHFDIKSKKCAFISYTCGIDEPAAQKQQTCKENDKLGVAGDCSRYQVCQNGAWRNTKCYFWGKFDIVTKGCRYFTFWKAQCSL